MEKRKIWKIGIVFLLVLGLTAYMETQGGELKDGVYIERNDAGDGDKEITLELEIKDKEETYEYEVEVPEVLFTESEANVRMEEVISEIDRDFAEVEDRIPMKESYQSGLVEVTWKLDPSNCVDMEGNVIREQIPPEGLVVNVESYLECQNYKKTYCFAFWIPPQETSDTEELLLGISSYIEAETKEEGKKELKLPAEMNGLSLTWKEKEKHLVAKIFLLEIVVVILLVLSGAEKKKEAEKKRREGLELDYPEIVGQITILLGAGMTISQAWNRIATRYEEKKQKRVIEERPAYEEILWTSRYMQESKNEREALTLMEKRVQHKAYHRLIRILLNHKSKGGRDLCKDLEQETANAYEQRILLAKQKGEEASTKLLLPMILMMVLVMAIVMLPAFIEFAG